jgi:hypothetical protein
MRCEVSARSCAHVPKRPSGLGVGSGRAVEEMEADLSKEAAVICSDAARLKSMMISRNSRGSNSSLDCWEIAVEVCIVSS